VDGGTGGGAPWGERSPGFNSWEGAFYSKGKIRLKGEITGEKKSKCSSCLDIGEASRFKFLACNPLGEMKENEIASEGGALTGRGDHRQRKKTHEKRTGQRVREVQGFVRREDDVQDKKEGGARLVSGRRMPQEEGAGRRKQD